MRRIAALFPKNYHRPLLAPAVYADPGFSLIEVMVVTAIVVSLLSVILINFPQLNERILIHKAGQLLELDLRSAQNKAFAVRAVQCPAAICPPTGGPVVPKGYGLRIRANTPSYFMFADLNNNKTYDVATDVVVQTTTFERGLRITATQDALGNSFCAGGDVDINFSSPAARMQIFCNGSAGGVTQAKITITSPGVGIETSVVTIITTGQILVQ